MMATNSPFNLTKIPPTKKQIKADARLKVRKVVDSGEVSLIDNYLQAKRAKEFIDEYVKNMHPKAKDEFQDEYGFNHKVIERSGAKIEFRNGGYTLNYSEDPVYRELEDKLKARKELLKMAQKQTVYDEDGVEVPKVSKKPRADSLTMIF